MSYPTYEYITIDRILAECKIELDLQGSTDDIRITRWIIEAIDEMQTLLDYVEKTFVLEICNGIAVLPCEFVRFDRPNPILFTQAGLATDNTFLDNYSLTYTGGPFLTNAPYCSFLNTAEVQDGKIYFSTGITETQCTISCLVVNLNEDGTPKIPIANKRPVIAYVGYKYLRATSGRGDLMMDYKNEWTYGKLDRRGKSVIPDSLQKQQMSRIMNTLLSSQGIYAAY